jgi:hypothetical protein
MQPAVAGLLATNSHNRPRCHTNFLADEADAPEIAVEVGQVAVIGPEVPRAGPRGSARGVFAVPRVRLRTNDEADDVVLNYATTLSL